MITYCKKCDINWAGLRQVESEAYDEVYEVCPKCSSSLDLEEGNSLTSYVWNPITGAITDRELGILHEDAKHRPPVIQMRPWEKWETTDEYQARVESAIDAYTTACASGNSNAIAVYFEHLKIAK